MAPTYVPTLIGHEEALFIMAGAVLNFHNIEDTGDVEDTATVQDDCSVEGTVH
jgi:hypothetical protein